MAQGYMHTDTLSEVQKEYLLTLPIVKSISATGKVFYQEWFKQEAVRLANEGVEASVIWRMFGVFNGILESRQPAQALWQWQHNSKYNADNV